MNGILGIGVRALLLVCLFSPVIAASPKTTPVECPPEMVCFTIEEAHRINVKLIELERDLKIAKAKKLRRFGPSIGCTVGYEFETSGPGINCGLMYGFRW